VAEAAANKGVGEIGAARGARLPEVLPVGDVRQRSSRRKRTASQRELPLTRDDVARGVGDDQGEDLRRAAMKLLEAELEAGAVRGADLFHRDGQIEDAVPVLLDIGGRQLCDGLRRLRETDLAALHRVEEVEQETDRPQHGDGESERQREGDEELSPERAAPRLAAQGRRSRFRRSRFRRLGGRRGLKARMHADRRLVSRNSVWSMIAPLASRSKMRAARLTESDVLPDARRVILLGT
jgi:hypothetical protein